MQSPYYASKQFAAPQAVPMRQPKKMGFSPVPNVFKNVMNNGLFGAGPAPKLFGQRRNVSMPEISNNQPQQQPQEQPSYPVNLPSWLNHQNPYGSQVLSGNAGNMPLGDRIENQMRYGKQDDGWNLQNLIDNLQPEQQPLALEPQGMLDTPMQVAPAPNGWVEPSAEEASRLQQQAIDEYFGGGSNSPLAGGMPQQESRRMPQQKFGMPDGYTQQPNMTPQMPQMPIQFDPMQRPQSPMAGLQMADLINPQFANMDYGARNAQALLDWRLQKAMRGQVMSDVAAPLFNTLGAFMPKDGRAAMNDYASGFANAYRARNGEREKIQDELYRLQGSARDNAKFMNDYAQYWDPASPTNQNKGIQQYMDYAKLYQTGQGNNIDAYKAYSERMKPVMELPMRQGQLDVSRQNAMTNEKRQAAYEKYYNDQMLYKNRALDVNNENQDQSRDQRDRINQSKQEGFDKNRASKEKIAADANALKKLKMQADSILAGSKETDKSKAILSNPAVAQAMMDAGMLPPTYQIQKPQPKEAPRNNVADFLNQFVGNKPQVQAPPAALNFYRGLPANQKAAAKQQFMQKYGIDPDKVR